MLYKELVSLSLIRCSYIYGGYVVFLSHVHKMMHIHCSSVDIRCNKSWEANLLCKNPHKNDKIQVQVHYSVNAHKFVISIWVFQDWFCFPIFHTTYIYGCASFHNFWKPLSRFFLEEFSWFHREAGLHPIFSREVISLCCLCSVFYIHLVLK
jgi:hypothetical protein